MPVRSAGLETFTIGLLASGLALAQAPPPPAPAPSPAPITSGAPLPDEPPKLRVDDPMLAPMPPPKHVITSWEDAARMMRQRSTDLQSSYADIRRAEADSRTALAAVLPTLNGTGTASHTILPKASSGGGSVIDTGTSAGAQVVPGGGGGRNSLTGSLRLNVPLVDVRAWHAMGTAKVSEDAAHLDYQNLERTTAASLASAIAVNVTAERVSELGRVGLRNALERLALTQAKERTGTATGLDIVRARQDVAQARSQLVTSDESLRKSRDALGLALGLTEPVGVIQSTDLAAIRDGVLKACRQLPKIENRADLLAADKSIEVAHRRRVEVDQSFLPTLSAGSTLTESISDSGAPGRTNWNVQAVLNVPIWDGGVRYGQRRNAAAIEDQAQLAREALRRNTTVDLIQARRNVDVAEESRRVSEEVRQLAFEVDRLTRAAYQTGKGTSLDLITSAAALRQAELDLAVDELGLVQARIASLLTLADCSADK
jgi:multidrug efflux system outer membrane protein